MADVVQTQFRVLSESSVVLMARIVDYAGSRCTQAALSAIEYTAYAEDEEGTLTAVTGHTGVALVVASTIYDTLQTTAALWTADTTGFNFKAIPDVSVYPLFVSGKTYVVKVKATPVSGQVIRWDYRGVCA